MLKATSFSDPSPQRVHLTPTAPREGGQSPELTSRDQNQPHLRKGQCLHPVTGEGRDLTVQDTAIVADIPPGHTLPGPGEAHTVHTVGLEYYCLNVYMHICFVLVS